MSNYSLQIGWAAKDDLDDTNPEKIISGDDFDTEFRAVQTAVNSKADLNGNASQSFSTNNLTVAGSASVTNYVTAKAGRSGFSTDNTGPFNLSTAQNFDCTPAASIQLSFSNVPDGQSGYVLLRNTGGETVTIDSSVIKATASAASELTATGTYLVSYYANGTNVYLTTSGAIV
jgi:hypothetical protein